MNGATEGGYSKPVYQGERLRRMVQVATAYRAGAPTTELRQRYGLSQGSVLTRLAE